MIRLAWIAIALPLLVACGASPLRVENAPDYNRVAQVLASDDGSRAWATALRDPHEVCSIVGKGRLGCSLPEFIERSAHNRFITDYYRSMESRVRDSRAERPGMCVALSGGGIRSAAFSIGAMQGLADTGLADKIDVLSATSGGGYALAWMSHALATEKQLRLTQLLSDAAVIGALEKRVETSWYTSASPAVTIALSLPARLVSLYWLVVDQLIKIPFPSVDAPRITTEGMLRDAFMPPKERFWERVGKHGWRGITSRSATVAELAQAVDERRMPLPIWTSMASVDTPKCEPGPLDRGVFEMSPYRQGSHWLGYTDKYHAYGKEISLLAAVAGAALDSPCLEQRPLLDVLIGRFGSRFPVFYASPLVVDTGDIPSPRTRTFVRLIDGGDVENLSAYPLVRRLCERIVIVDGTEDAKLLFKSYHLLKGSLLAQGIDFSVPGIEALAGAYDKHQDEPLKQACEQVRPTPAGCLAARRVPLPVFKGEIREIPFDAGDGKRDLRIDVTYVKLAMSEAGIESYPQAVQTYWSALDTECRNTFQRGCQFPQDLTLYQHFPQARFRAYRELGRHYVAKCLERNGALKPECAR